METIVAQLFFSDETELWQYGEREIAVVETVALSVFSVGETQANADGKPCGYNTKLSNTVNTNPSRSRAAR